MQKISIKCKPLSVNAAWQGRRYKTNDYKIYEVEVSALLQGVKKQYSGTLEIEYRFFLKNHKTTDYDNLIKPLQDILCKKGIIEDDRFIYKATIEKIPSEENRIEIVIYEKTP